MKRSWGVSGQLEATWRCLGAVQNRLGGVLEGLRGALEVSWKGLGASWGHLGRLPGRVAGVCSRRPVFSHVFSTCCRKVKICFIWSILQKHGTTCVFRMFFLRFYGLAISCAY